jgi:pimeloyl-ACP methyl ester carboxylesterase
MTWLIALIAALAVFLISATVIIFIIGPTLLLQPRRRKADFYRKLGLPTNPEELNLDYEEINIQSADGFRLNCWLIKSKETAKATIVYIHGVADCKIDGLRFAKLMHDNNFNVFLFDSRRHGDSEGTHCTYGFYEKLDVINIIDYLSARKDIHIGKIGLFGTSMGAAIAIQTAAIDNRISAVVSENSFAALRKIFDDYQRRIIKLPFHYLRNIVIIHSELRAKFKARDVAPLESVKNITAPILFVYGTVDPLIKYEYSIKLFEQANQPKDIFPINGAAHNNTWDIGGETYHKKLLDFYKRHLI